MGAAPGHAYIVGPPLSLQEMMDASDLVVKATALGTEPVADERFRPLSGFRICSTRFKVVSTLKGEADDEIRFHHYGKAPGRFGIFYAPQYLDFKAGRTYLLWAKKSDNGAWSQVSTAPTMRPQGACLTLDATPAAAASGIKATVWNELNLLLTSDDGEDVRYAIRELDSRSDIRSGTATFDRTAVLNAIAPFFKSQDVATAETALKAAANGDARPVEMALIQAATGTGPKLRAGALRALLGLKTDDARKTAFAATHDQEPEVRATALLLVADFDGHEARVVWQEAARDGAEAVRIGAANGMLRARDGETAGALDTLIDDKSPLVRQAAATALLVLPAASARSVWRKRSAHPEFWMVFTNALAAEDSAPYRAALARILRTSARPPGNVTLGGQDPVYTAWYLLFNDLRRRRPDFQTAPDNRPLWKALEACNWGSAEPEQLYEWYRRIGMEERAQIFRRDIEAKNGNMRLYFDRADETIEGGRPWSH